MADNSIPQTSSKPSQIDYRRLAWLRNLSKPQRRAIIGDIQTQVVERVRLRDIATFTSGTDYIASVSTLGLRSSEVLRYRIGQLYRFQLKRIGCIIRITNIIQRDVRDIDERDVSQLGFVNQFEFWQSWCSTHDPDIVIKSFTSDTVTLHRIRSGEFLSEDYFGFWRILKKRPPALYEAWIITFEKVGMYET